MTSKKTKIIVAASVITLLAGLGIYSWRQYQLLDKLCYSVKRFRVLKFGITNTVVALDLIIKNLGSLDLDVKSISIDVYAKDVFVTRIVQTFPVKILPEKTSSLPLQIALNPKEVLKGAGGILANTNINQIPLTFNGKAVVTKFGIPIGIPFDMTYTIAELKSGEGESPC